ncbi:MAG: hypothetical protein WCA85_05030 [Paraburkholderia sp.]|uniref:hypothetical protein n=1 Tax=Paraburkholderia sp. TaxID=1926495 RepID=UPI003C3BE735
MSTAAFSTAPFDSVHWAPALSIIALAGGIVVPDVDSVAALLVPEGVEVPEVSVVLLVFCVPLLPVVVPLTVVVPVEVALLVFVLVLAGLVLLLVLTLVDAPAPEAPPPPPHAANARVPAPASSPLKNLRRDAGASTTLDGRIRARENRSAASIGVRTRLSRDIVSHPYSI